MRLGALKKRIASPVNSLQQPLRIPSLGNGVSKPLGKEDIKALLESVRECELPDSGDDYHVDWMGVRTRISMLPWAPRELAGTTSTALPIPDDSYRSEASEYAALALATNRAIDTLCVVEVGAGWAPWVVAGLVVAKRTGLRGRGIAIEAHLEHAKWAITHAHDNGIEAELITGTPIQIIDALRASTTEMQVVHAAGWIKNTYLSFPEAAAEDMGVAVGTTGDTGTDYRGAHLPHIDVPAVALNQIFGAINMRIDLLHIDVQGVEFELTSHEAAAIQASAVTMAIGTHSRIAEGKLQQFFLERGWGLRIDEPCTAVFTMTHPTLAGFTVQDGLQLYENPFLLDQIKN